MKMFIVKHALRSVVRMRMYTLINVVGLIVSFVGAIVIARYAHQELTVDSCVPELDRLGMVVNVDIESGSGMSPRKCVNYNGNPDFDNILADPAVELYTNFTPVLSRVDVVVGGSRHYDPRVIGVDSLFLSFFPREVHKGSLRMNEPNDVIVSRSFAEMVWGDDNPVGQKMMLNFKEVSVVGVVEEATSKCNFDYDILVDDNFIRWGFVGISVVRLAPSTECEEVNRRHRSKNAEGDGSAKFYQLVPLDGLYYNDNIILGNNAHNFILRGDSRLLMMLIVAAVMLLAVGMFNYVNIFVIVSLCRRRSFVVRKVFGASTGVIFRQIFCENLIVSVIAVAVSWMIVLVVSPLASSYYSIQQLPAPMFDICLTLAIVVGFPLVISVPSVINYRSAQMNDDNAAPGKFSFRQLCLFVQYVVTFFLVVVCIFSVMQMRYMLNADMGYRTTDILRVSMSPEGHGLEQAYAIMSWTDVDKMHTAVADRTNAIVDKLRQSTLIAEVVNAPKGDKVSLTKRKARSYTVKVKREDSDNGYIDVSFSLMTPEMCSIYGLELVEGHLPRLDKGESMFAYCLIVDEKCIEQLGITDFHNQKVQFSKRLWYDSNNFSDEYNPPFEVLGIFKDYVTVHLGLYDYPKVICLDEALSINGDLLIRVAPDRHDEAFEYIRKIFVEENGPDAIMEYKWIEDELEEIYDDDSRMMCIYTTFAVLSIIVSFLGLLGISLYDVQRRRREIAIRKVNGAKFPDIFRIVIRRYLVALAVSFVVGTPLTLYALRVYMDGYVNHIDLSPLYFIVAALFMLLITAVTIYCQVRKAASENPAEVMKTE